MDAIVNMFRRNFPNAVRSDAAIAKILGESDIIYREDAFQKPIAAAIISGDTIYMLCVDECCRRSGIGSALLAECEARIRKRGCSRARIGAGDDYLIPGVPMSAGAHEFFQKRGYVHSWGDCECFDMSMALNDFTYSQHRVGDDIAGLTYRWATAADIPAIRACTDDACPEFTKFYEEPALYANSDSRVLAAVSGDTVCGAVIVNIGAEAPDTGSVGCTSVMQAHRGHHIAANMVLLGTRYLKERGLARGFVGYTYSGLEKLYGIAGYSISERYFMAAKEL